MSMLEAIKELISNSQLVYTNKYNGNSYNFTENYVNDDSGLLENIKNAHLNYPIQYEVEGDFYFFATELDLKTYIVSVLSDEDMIYQPDNDDDYYDSSEYEDSGC